MYAVRDPAREALEALEATELERLFGDLFAKVMENGVPSISNYLPLLRHANWCIERVEDSADKKAMRKNLLMYAINHQKWYAVYAMIYDLVSSYLPCEDVISNYLMAPQDQYREIAEQSPFTALVCAEKPAPLISVLDYLIYCAAYEIEQRSGSTLDDIFFLLPVLINLKVPVQDAGLGWAERCNSLPIDSPLTKQIFDMLCQSEFYQHIFERDAKEISRQAKENRSDERFEYLPTNYMRLRSALFCQGVGFEASEETYREIRKQIEAYPTYERPLLSKLGGVLGISTWNEPHERRTHEGLYLQRLHLLDVLLYLKFYEDIDSSATWLTWLTDARSMKIWNAKNTVRYLFPDHTPEITPDHPVVALSSQHLSFSTLMRHDPSLRDAVVYDESRGTRTPLPTYLALAPWAINERDKHAYFTRPPEWSLLREHWLRAVTSVARELAGPG